VIEVHHVPTSFVHQQWAAVADHLAAALEHAHGDVTLDQLRADLGSNRAALYKWVDDGQVVGAAAVVFQNQRNARVAFVVAIGGRGVYSRAARDQFFELLRRGGATKVAGAMRDSMLRLNSRMGLKKKYIIAEADL
jgi:hypothetical protein